MITWNHLCGQSWSLYLTTFCAIVLFCIFLNRTRRRKNIPPGKLGWPILGATDIFSGKRTVLQHFLDINERYQTEITSIRLAGNYLVSLNSYDVIREVMQMKEMRDRGNLTLMKVDPDYRGVIHASGSIWQEHRRFCLKNLRDFGMGKADGELLIQNEIKHLVEHLNDHLNEPLDTRSLLSPTINNTMCLFLFNKRYQYTDFRSFDRLRELDRLMMTIIPMSKPFIYTPKLMYLPGDLFGYKESRKRLKLFYDYIEEQIEEKRGVKDASFISAFMTEREKELPEEGTTTFTEAQLKYTIMDLFMAGTDTVTTFLRWALLILAYYPKLQGRLQHEIFKHLGRNDASMKDKANLKLVQAFIMEVHRYASISPTSLPHSPADDVQIRGYCLPKGSSVFANIYAVHRDVNYWKNANEVDLENFLDGDGNVVNNQRLIPFSIGKRSCVGEALAKMEIFLILVNLIQRFRFKLAEPLTSLEGNMEGMNYPPEHRLVITERTVLNGPQTPEPESDQNQSNDFKLAGK